MKVFLAFLVILLVSSCMYRNYAKGDKKFCTVHHSSLKRKLVAMQYGYPDFANSSYPFRKRTVSLGCERPAHVPLFRMALIYVCDSCTLVWKHHMKGK